MNPKLLFHAIDANRESDHLRSLYEAACAWADAKNIFESYMARIKLRKVVENIRREERAIRICLNYHSGVEEDK